MDGNTEKQQYWLGFMPLQCKWYVPDEPAPDEWSPLFGYALTANFILRPGYHDTDGHEITQRHRPGTSLAKLLRRIPCPRACIPPAAVLPLTRYAALRAAYDGECDGPPSSATRSSPTFQPSLPFCVCFQTQITLPPPGGYIKHRVCGSVHA